MVCDCSLKYTTDEQRRRALCGPNRERRRNSTHHHQSGRRVGEAVVDVSRGGYEWGGFAVQCNTSSHSDAKDEG